MAATQPIPATVEAGILPGSSAPDSENIVADGGRLDSLLDIQALETIHDRLPRQSQAIRAVRLLLVARKAVERQIVALHVLQGDGLDAAAYAIGLSPARTRELFRNLECRYSAAHKRISRLRKLAKKRDEAKGRRHGKASRQPDGPIVPRLVASGMASDRAGMGIPGAADADDRGPSVGRDDSAPPHGMPGTAGVESDFPQDFQED